MITQGRRRRPSRSAVPLSTAHRSAGTAPVMEAMRVRPKLALIMRHASGTLWARMDWDRARWGCMTREPEPSRSAGPTVIRLGEEDWRAWRAVRLAALADAPGAFGSTLEHEQALGEEAWRAMTRGAAILVAVAGGIPIGVVAGVGRPSAGERGLGAMWVTPAWRSHGVAALLVGAVIDWARDEGCAQVGLWVPADNARARRFCERQGFRATGHSRPFPATPSARSAR